MTIPLSILDLCGIERDATPAQALANSVELARVAERLGYTRYWFAEHHNSERLASGSPEIMIAHVAAQTRTIHVGAGGVMLPNHPPLRIAEIFRLLETLHPGRIDLGLGRAPGTDTLTAYALRRSEEAIRTDQYPALLGELLALDSGGFPPEHPFARISVTPVGTRLPPIWLLGSSDFSAQFAAEVGLGFSFAAHINGSIAVPVMRLYRERFQPSEYRQQPHAILAVGVVVGEDEQHARDLAKVVRIGLASLGSGKPERLPTIEEARARELTPLEIEQSRRMYEHLVIGDGATVAARLRELAAETQADEVMLTTFLPSQPDRLRMATAVAAAWRLAPSTPSAVEAAVG